MGAHLLNGQFQSDKYPGCPAGKVPLSVNDPLAQPLLWAYAESFRAANKDNDPEFADDVQEALRLAGFRPPTAMCFHCEPSRVGATAAGRAAPPTCSKCGKPCTDGHWVGQAP